MKKISIIMAGAMMLLFSSCENFLSVNPQQSLAINEVYSSTSDLETALIGAYNSLSLSDVMGCNLTMVPEIVADNGSWRGSFPSFVDISNQAPTPANGEVSGLWQFGYRAINDVNVIIEAIPTITDGEIAAAGPGIRGECLFIRGALYFEMVRHFGKPYGSSSSSDLGIPVLTAPTRGGDEIVFPARGTVQQAYDQAIADLTEAVGLLPETNSLGFATSWAAKAYLAEIYFQQGNYEAASGEANDIIDGPFSLNAAANEFFTQEGSGESIFELEHTTQDNPGVNGSLPTFHHVNGRGGDVVVSVDLRTNGFDQIVTADQATAIANDGLTVVDTRSSTLTSDGGTFSDAGGSNIEKYEDFVNNADNAPVHRLAEFMLMRAEALVRNGAGVNQESIDLLNQIRLRSLIVTDGNGAQVDATPYVAFEIADFADEDALLEAIILERRVELAFEGNRLHDLKRLERDVNGTAFDADVLVWPIPQRDLDANSSLVQNPGY